MVRSSRYVDAPPSPVSVKEAIRQYTKRKSASARVGPLGLNAAIRSNDSMIDPITRSPNIPWSW